MSIAKPYYRICRPFASGEYVQSLEGDHITDNRYAADRVNLVRAYHLLERDLYKIFDYVEPSDKNLNCYSHELYALLLRAATEFELSARSILGKV